MDELPAVMWEYLPRANIGAVSDRAALSPEEMTGPSSYAGRPVCRFSGHSRVWFCRAGSGDSLQDCRYPRRSLRTGADVSGDAQRIFSRLRYGLYFQAAIDVLLKTFALILLSFWDQRAWHVGGGA